MNIDALQAQNAQKAKQLVELACKNHVTISCAESCTGGLLSAYITSVPGSSACMMGGVVSYACSVKHDVLGVTNGVLDSVGAVSSECAFMMCEGAQRVLKSDLAVSITGIAGPTGATPTKPVGLVWFGRADNTTQTFKKIFDGDRQEVREQSVSFALDLLLEATAAFAKGEC